MTTSLGRTVCRVSESGGRVVIETTPRRAEAILLVLSGATLKEVGQRFGLTRERIRQYMAQAGLSTRNRQLIRSQPYAQRRWRRGLQGRRRLSRTERQERKFAVIAAIKTVGQQSDGIPSVKAVAAIIFARPLAKTECAVALGNYLVQGSRRRISRALRAAWHMAGYELPAKGKYVRSAVVRAALGSAARKYWISLSPRQQRQRMAKMRAGKRTG